MSLIEVLVTILVLTTILTVTISAYLAGQEFWQEGVKLNEITQNSRLAIDRISRELRQTDEIITILPAVEIEFEDGHNKETLQYLRYYLDNNLLHRQIIAYLLDDAPVRWNVPGAEKTTKEDQIIAEYIEAIQFSGSKLIQIDINDFSTKVTGRNIK